MSHIDESLERNPEANQEFIIGQRRKEGIPVQELDGTPFTMANTL